jgi:hypothetical protein
MKCPICNKTLHEKDLENHYQLERKRMIKVTAKRKKLSISNLSEIQERINSIEERSNSRSIIKIKTQNCFICGINLPDDLEFINEHIDTCVLRHHEGEEQLSAVDLLQKDVCIELESEKDWEEYEWDGETRIRTTSAYQGAFESLGFHVRSKNDKDTEEDIDIDDDETDLYGNQQFNESNLQEFYDDSDKVSVPPKVQESVLIDALKSRIRELECKQANDCLVCKGTFINPCTSIICWHVHCEKCWFQTLAAKRLCPQCQQITGPSDLRRIYF